MHISTCYRTLKDGCRGVECLVNPLDLFHQLTIVGQLKIEMIHPKNSSVITTKNIVREECLLSTKIDFICIFGGQLNTLF